MPSPGMRPIRSEREAMLDREDPRTAHLLHRPSILKTRCARTKEKRRGYIFYSGIFYFVILLLWHFSALVFFTLALSKSSSFSSGILLLWLFSLTLFYSGSFYCGTFGLLAFFTPAKFGPRRVYDLIEIDY